MAEWCKKEKVSQQKVFGNWLRKQGQEELVRKRVMEYVTVSHSHVNAAHSGLLRLQPNIVTQRKTERVSV